MGVLHQGSAMEKHSVSTADTENQDGDSEAKQVKPEDDTDQKPARSVLVAIFQVSVVLLLDSCTSIIHFPLEAQYVYEYYAYQHGVNSSAPAPRPGCDVGNASNHGNVSDVEVQKDSANFLMLSYLAYGIPATIATLVVGAFADRIGRKPIFVLSTLGRLGYDLLTVATILWRLDVYVLYAGLVIDGLSGSTATLMLAIFAYTADMTPAKGKRTLALTSIDAFIAIVGAAVNLAMGYIIKNLGYVYVAVLSASLTTIQLLYILFVLRESRQVKDKLNLTCSNVVPETLMGIKGIFKFYVQKDQTRNRGLFVLGLTTFFFLVLVRLEGPITIYQLGPPFCWDSVKIGWFAALSSFCSSILSLGFVRLLQCCVSDAVIAAIGLLSYAGRDVILGLATNSAMLYIAAVVGFCALTAVPVVRSLLSSMATADEQGALFASMSAVRVVGSMAGYSFSSYLYKVTLTIMRGAIFLMTAGCNLLMVVLMIIFVVVHRKHTQRLQAAKAGEETSGAAEKDMKLKVK